MASESEGGNEEQVLMECFKSMVVNNLFRPITCGGVM